MHLASQVLHQRITSRVVTPLTVFTPLRVVTPLKVVTPLRVVISLRTVLSVRWIRAPQAFQRLLLCFRVSPLHRYHCG